MKIVNQKLMNVIKKIIVALTIFAIISVFENCSQNRGEHLSIEDYLKKKNREAYFDSIIAPFDGIIVYYKNGNQVSYESRLLNEHEDIDYILKRELKSILLMNSKTVIIDSLLTDDYFFFNAYDPLNGNHHGKGKVKNDSLFFFYMMYKTMDSMFLNEIMSLDLN